MVFCSGCQRHHLSARAEAPSGLCKLGIHGLGRALLCCPLGYGACCAVTKTGTVFQQHWGRGWSVPSQTLGASLPECPTPRVSQAGESARLGEGLANARRAGAVPVFNWEMLKEPILSVLILEVTVLIRCGKNVPLCDGFNSYRNLLHSPESSTRARF